MNKKVRSISIAEHIDDKLIQDSSFRGLTISANLTRILHEYFQNQPNNKVNGIKLKVKKR